MLRPLRAFILFPTPFKGIYFVSYAPSGHLFFTLCPLRTFILYALPLKGIYSVSYAPQGRLFFPLCPLSEVYCLLARCFSPPRAAGRWPGRHLTSVPAHLAAGPHTGGLTSSTGGGCRPRGAEALTVQPEVFESTVSKIIFHDGHQGGHLAEEQHLVVGGSQLGEDSVQELKFARGTVQIQAGREERRAMRTWKGVIEVEGATETTKPRCLHIVGLIRR